MLHDGYAESLGECTASYCGPSMLYVEEFGQINMEYSIWLHFHVHFFNTTPFPLKQGLNGSS